MNTPDNMLTLGKISGVFGVKGWVKIYSHTSPLQQIIKYSPIYLRKKDGWQAVKIVKGQRQGKGVIAQLEGVDDRDQAFSLIGTEIGIERDQLEDLSSDTYYWTDLQGMSVFTLDDIPLGVVDWVFNAGSTDVLVVKSKAEGEKNKERMIPWIKDDVIKSVNLEQSLLVVDWDPDF